MHVNKFHNTKTKTLVGSYETLLFSNQSKARILWANCTELTIFALNEVFFALCFQKTALLSAIQNRVILSYILLGNQSHC